MSSFKKIIQDKILPIIIDIGLERLLSGFSGNNILNIMYHGVVEEDSTPFSPRHISKVQFEQHLRYFRRNFDVIPLEKGFDVVQGSVKLKRKAITISFDDGYANNLTTALPLLEKYNLPATFFICGCCVDEDFPIIWADLIAFLRYSMNDEPLELVGYKFQKFGRYDFVDIQSNLSLYDYIKKMNAPERDSFLDQLDKKYNIRKRINEVNEEFWKLMTPKQILTISQSPVVSIGSHSTKHYNLGFISPQYAEIDMRLSKLLLESIIQKEINMLAFPDGNYSPVVKKLAKEIGFEYMLAVNYLLEEDKTDQSILNRHGISCTIPFAQNTILLNYAFNTHGYR